MAIVLVTSYGYEGTGDFVFIENTALAILKAYPREDLLLVSQSEGVQIYQDILKIDHPNIRLCDIRTFNALVESKKIDISLYIEGPVFNVDMHTDNKLARATIIGPDLMKYKTTVKIKLPTNIPVLLMPEYGKMEKTEADMQALQCELERQGAKEITVLRSGFCQQHYQQGIYFNDFLLRYVRSKKTLKALYAKLSSTTDDIDLIRILSNDQPIPDTFKDNDISLEYSKTNNEIFIRMQAAWAAKREKPQIIIGIGGADKKSQLMKNLKPLTKQFSSIQYINVNTGEKIQLHTSESSSTKTYQFIHINTITHETMLALILLSGPIMGATGDGSLAEALAAKKVIAYECLEYKTNVAKGLTREFAMANSEFHAIFIEFFHRPAQGNPPPLSKKAGAFLQSDQAIIDYQENISHLPRVFNLAQALIETIEMLIKGRLVPTHHNATDVACSLKQKCSSSSTSKKGGGKETKVSFLRFKIRIIYG